MGCITSKVMSKSISFKEELNQSLQRRSNSISSIHELILSGNKNDHFLNLLYTPNIADTKIQSDSNTNPKPETMDADDLATRSKSCHWFPEYQVSSMDSCDEIKEDESNTSKKLNGRARSIHTVEEYDAILEKLWQSRSQQTDRKSTGEASEEKMSAEAQEQSISEKGFKRKAVAKGLESLSLPQTIEFQNFGSLKDWVQDGGQVYSPGAYVTPKFGSYALPCSKTERKSVAFNPELVAAFEECMLQLHAEEEIVLRQTAEDLEEEKHDGDRAEREEDVSSCSV